MLDMLNSKDVCCHSIAELEFKEIESLPYKTPNRVTSDWEIIDEHSQVMSFAGDKSYVIGFEIPDITSTIGLQFVSLPTWSHIEKGGYFSPVVRTFDSNFIQLQKFQNFRFEADTHRKVFGYYQVSGIFGSIDLPENTKYVVFHTNRSELSRSTSFYWNGSSHFNVDAERKLGRQYVVPNVPEGALLVDIDYITSH